MYCIVDSGLVRAIHVLHVGMTGTLTTVQRLTCLGTQTRTDCVHHVRLFVGIKYHPGTVWFSSSAA
jgi:hypothetical protein